LYGRTCRSAKPVQSNNVYVGKTCLSRVSCASEDFIKKRVVQVLGMYEIITSLVIVNELSL